MTRIVTREEMIQKLNQRISDPNSVVLFRCLGRWIKIDFTVKIIDWDKYLEIPGCKGLEFIGQSPEQLKAFLVEKFRVYDAKLIWEWLC